MEIRPTKGVRGLVLTYQPLVSDRDLALHLAEALQGIADQERDASAYLQQVQVENQKLTQLRFTLDQAKRYQNNPPPNPSRMDPLLSYDLDDLQKQINECKTNAARWTEIRENALNKAQELKAESARIQAELRDRRKRG